jgi:AcrR family transcriptional regulator
MASSDRREHLVLAGMAELAISGYAGCSLDRVAQRAGVTRNLVYHYFPRGRPDLFLAVAHRAGRELTDGWITDETIPLPERMAANFARLSAHAAEPSDAWRVFREGRTIADPEIREVTDRYLDRVVSAIALNHLGMAAPSPLVRTALRAFIAYAEVALEDARERDLPSDAIFTLLTQTLVRTLRAARVL